jgi:RNA-directed DNA polymerase
MPKMTSISLLTPEQKDQAQAFLSLKTPRDIAKLLDLEYGRLVYHLYKVPEEAKYKTFELPKKSGGTREINSPITAIKLIQQKLSEVLLNVYQPKPSVFSYVRHKNIALNAKKHKRAKYILNIDLENYFPSINFGRVRGLFIGKPYYLPPNVATVLAQICCYKNVLPQGAPTSPIISNMICAQMDSQLQYFAMDHKCYYTRYADDITFSTFLNEFPDAIAHFASLTDVELSEDIKAIITNNGFRINYRKVRLQPRYRRQEVTGLTVNKFPNVQRKYVRQVRGMLYAWSKYGITDAEKEHFVKHNTKYRNPDLELPSFRQIVKGKIEFIGMVKGRKDQIYRKLIDKYEALDARDKGIPRLSTTIFEDVDKPYIFVEGKTDRLILVNAWKKLYDNARMEFVIAESDTKPSSAGGSGGAGSVQLLLNAHRAADPHIRIGLFDRDDGGKKEYLKLQSDFIEDQENGWKTSGMRKAAGLLLPVPQGKENYDYYHNLCIEFYFSETALSTKTEGGKSLEFEFPPIIVKGTKLPESEQKKILETRMIKSGKLLFATEVVPQLEPKEFESFKLLFEKLISLIEHIQSTSHT